MYHYIRNLLDGLFILLWIVVIVNVVRINGIVIKQNNMDKTRITNLESRVEELASHINKAE